MNQRNSNENLRPVGNDNFMSKVAWSNDFKKYKKKHGYRVILKDFLENTTLHGLKYIGLTRITIFER